MESLKYSSGNPRVLIVDNDPRTRLSNQFLLEHWGYETIPVSGDGFELKGNAKLDARRSRCSLALVDLRLMDDSDEDDTSGLELAEGLGPVRSIIFSGHGNSKVLLEMMEKHKDVIFISKSDRRPVIQAKLDAEAKKMCAAKRGLQFDPPNILELLAQTPLGHVTGDYPDQFADVFARLFPDAQKLRIVKLDSRLSSSQISTVPRPNSIILKVYEVDTSHDDEYEPVIVKLARAQKIDQEIQRYDRYIHRRMGGNYAPRLERHVTLWDIGGAVYTFVGDFNARTFSQYYEDSSSEQIEASLRAFFTGTWSRLYERAVEKQQVSLFELYCSVWERDWYEKRVQKFIMPLLSADLNGLHQRLAAPDPIEWFKTRIADHPSTDASLVAATRVAITHGDLHADNLLVDGKQNAWVIDFERSGEGHALQDFIELEADLLNRLIITENGAASFYRLCVAVVRPNEIGPIPLDEQVSSEAQIQKILKTMSVLRQLAGECTGLYDMRQYLLGLLFNAIFRATIIKNDNHHAKSQQRSLMLASIICHRLEHWGETWPPQEWQEDA